MKRYLLNPGDVICAITIMSIGGITAILITVGLFSGFPVSWGDVLACMILYQFPLLIVMLGVLYLNKYSGYFYFCDDNIIIKKGKKQTIIDIANIRWIEITIDNRGGRYAIDIGPRKNFRFCIRMQDQKKDIDAIITNNIMFEVIKKYCIRIMPDWFNETYLKTQNFDFLIHRKKK